MNLSKACHVKIIVWLSSKDDKAMQTRLILKAKNNGPVPIISFNLFFWWLFSKYGKEMHTRRMVSLKKVLTMTFKKLNIFKLETQI